MSHLDRLTQQLNELKAQTALATPVVPVVPMGPVDLSTQIQEAVKAALANELTEIRKLIDNQLPKKEMGLLEIIGLSLTPEEQVWLSSPPVQKYLPVFLQTTGGSDCIKLFVSELKDAYESKT